MIRSVCGYCGVGCGLEYEPHKLIGDIAYPTNEGKLCSKGISELISIQTPTRLLRPHIRKSIDQPLSVSSWEEAIATIANTIKATPKEKIGFYLSGQMLTEDYYIANKLAKGFLGTNNIDTNSRTCMASAVVAYKKSLGADFVPVRMEDIFKSNLLILVGANTAEAHVVFHNHIKKAKKEGLKVVVIDPRLTDTAKIADIYLPIKAGGDIDFFNLLSQRIIDEKLYDEDFVRTKLENFESFVNKFKRIPTTKMLKRTGLSSEEFEAFWQLYKSSPNIITAWTMGLNQSSQGVDKNLALINTHLLTGKIFKEGNGPLSLTGQPNAMGGREVGGLSTMLAVHLGFDEASIAKVSQFWKTDTINNQAGLTATQMLHANLDVLIICHTDPIYHLPPSTICPIATKTKRCYEKFLLLSKSTPTKTLRVPLLPIFVSQLLRGARRRGRKPILIEPLPNKKNSLEPPLIAKAIGKSFNSSPKRWDTKRRLILIAPKRYLMNTKR